MSGATDLEALSCIQIPSEIFRAYDIRGIYGEQLDETSIELIGRAIGSEALAQGIDTLLLGRDGRLSSPQLSEALVCGVLATGCNIVDLGLVPTPLVYFATHNTQWDSGIVLTASHNPASYNGIKIVFRQSCLADNQIQDIRRRIEQGQFTSGQGEYHCQEIVDNYVKTVCGQIDLARKLKIVIDCGNGVTGVVAPALFSALGCEVEKLFCEVNGHFPNHDPDPTQAENLEQLQARVLATQAHIGLAFDGDGDRLAVVTNEAEIIDTDRLLAVLVRNILPHHPSAKVVYDVKCSNRLATLIRDCGGIPVMHRSGHSLMKQKMQQTGAPIGGEFSAHIFIRDRWFGFDDGLYTAARLLEILAQDQTSAADLFAILGERYTTPELKVPVAESQKFRLMARILEGAVFPDGQIIEIDGLRVEFSDGWGLVRASNTSPALLLRFEAECPQALDRIQYRFRELLLQVDETLPINF